MLLNILCTRAAPGHTIEVPPQGPQSLLRGVTFRSARAQLKGRTQANESSGTARLVQLACVLLMVFQYLT